MHDQITLKNAAVPRGDINPLSNVRRWRQSVNTGNLHNLHDPHDLHNIHKPHHDALKHWERFRSCLEAMPPDEARTMWSTLSAEIEAQQTPTYSQMWRI